mmetsp:Transcript_135705/g.247460  ORF Transcript_135705/g.247460 Transcript_135705/m.247460 type:complete len:119 (-) Transcript_135705:105-461(-)
MDALAAARRDERVAAKALAAVKDEHDAARAQYVAHFSLLRRTFKDLGTRTRSYRADHVAPRERRLLEAQCRWETAAGSLREQERRRKEEESGVPMPLYYFGDNDSWKRPQNMDGNTVY